MVQGTLGVSTSSAQGQQTLKVISGQKTTLFTQVNTHVHTQVNMHTHTYKHTQVRGDCGIYLHIYSLTLSTKKLRLRKKINNKIVEKNKNKMLKLGNISRTRR